MNDETIDPSQWLNQSYHKAYPQAFARGMREHNGKIFCSTQFPFDELSRIPEKSPVLSASHLSAAEFITTLHEVAFYKTGYGKFNEIAAGMGIGKHERCPMTLFIHISRCMTRPHMAMVERLCWQPIRTNDWGWIDQCKGTIRASFDALGAAIEKALDLSAEKIEDTKIKGGQLRPESDPA